MNDGKRTYSFKIEGDRLERLHEKCKKHRLCLKQVIESLLEEYEKDRWIPSIGITLNPKG